MILPPTMLHPRLTFLLLLEAASRVPHRHQFRSAHLCLLRAHTIMEDLHRQSLRQLLVALVLQLRWVRARPCLEVLSQPCLQALYRWPLAHPVLDPWSILHPRRQLCPALLLEVKSLAPRQLTHSLLARQPTRRRIAITTIATDNSSILPVLSLGFARLTSQLPILLRMDCHLMFLSVITLQLQSPRLALAL